MQVFQETNTYKYAYIIFQQCKQPKNNFWHSITFKNRLAKNPHASFSRSKRRSEGQTLESILMFSKPATMRYCITKGGSKKVHIFSQIWSFNEKNGAQKF